MKTNGVRLQTSAQRCSLPGDSLDTSKPCSGNQRARKASAGLAVLAAVYLGLVGAYGEYWPFSHYPMYSDTTKHWTLVMIRELGEAEPPCLGDSMSRAQLPGKLVPARELRISVKPLREHLLRTTEWSPENKNLLRSLVITDKAHGRRLLVVKVIGRLDSGGRILLTYEPVVVVRERGYEFRANFAQQQWTLRR